MKRRTVHILAKISLAILLFILLSSFYTGVITAPGELDSIKYHIPIAKSYLTGQIFSSPDSPILHRFFPGASEGILAIFILLHMPLNLFNVLGAVLLAYTCYLLGKRAGLSKELSVLFATGFVSLTAVSRWLNIQIVDIYVAVFYSLTLYLLLKPEKRASYFFKLGSVAAMVVGSKYSGPLYIIILFSFFASSLFKKRSIKNAIVFLLPMLILGGSWYIRNYIVMGNPFYPLGVFGFPGVKGWALETPVWKAIIQYPISFGTALLSEYLGWMVALLIAPFYLVAALWTRKWTTPIMFVALAFFNMLAYLLLPNGEAYRVHVSNLRYSYPAFIPLVLAVFLLAKRTKKEELISLFTIACALFSIQVPYHPKLLLAYIPLLVWLWDRNRLQS